MRGDEKAEDQVPRGEQLALPLDDDVEVECPLCWLPWRESLQVIRDVEATTEEPWDAAEKVVVDSWLVINCPWSHDADDLVRYLDMIA